MSRTLNFKKGSTGRSVIRHVKDLVKKGFSGVDYVVHDFRTMFQMMEDVASEVEKVDSKLFLRCAWANDNYVAFSVLRRDKLVGQVLVGTISFIVSDEQVF